jgi:alanine dehydrogenase
LVGHTPPQEQGGNVKIAVPAEVKNHEYRVAITPAGVRELVLNWHQVVIEVGVGPGSSISDAEYQAAGAQVLGTADDVWSRGDLILKVKETIADEYQRMREGQVLFTYLHLAADKWLAEELIGRKVTGIAYETVQAPNGTLPLLAPCRRSLAGSHPRWVPTLS